MFQKNEYFFGYEDLYIFSECLDLFLAFLGSFIKVNAKFKMIFCGGGGGGCARYLLWLLVCSKKKKNINTPSSPSPSAGILFCQD